MAVVEPSDNSRVAKVRVDKWLWQARFFKTRSLAAELVITGRLRINAEHATKPSQAVRPGDVLTFPQGRRVRVIRIAALGLRRGPATEAQALYTDLNENTPQPAEPSAQVAVRETGTGRPTKKQRREIDALRRDGS